MNKTPNIIITENPNYTEKDFKFIENALKSASIFNSLEQVIDSHLRMLIEESNDTSYFIHIGSQDPENGGSGSSYEVNKSTSQVELLHTETYAAIDPEEDF